MYSNLSLSLDFGLLFTGFMTLGKLYNLFASVSWTVKKGKWQYLPHRLLKVKWDNEPKALNT